MPIINPVYKFHFFEGRVSNYHTAVIGILNHNISVIKHIAPSGGIGSNAVFPEQLLKRSCNRIFYKIIDIRIIGGSVITEKQISIGQTVPNNALFPDNVITKYQNFRAVNKIRIMLVIPGAALQPDDLIGFGR